MKATRHPVIRDIIMIEPRIFGDSRGYFLETYQAERYKDHDVPDRFVQDNISMSTRGVLRGLHYQIGRPQGKLVFVLQGEVFDVAVDIRKGSPTFGKWVGETLSAGNHKQIFIPEGFAHGFCVLSETAVFSYKCTDYYSAKDERGIRWDDLQFGIEWPVREPVVSDKDRALPSLAAVREEDLPRYS